LLTVGHSTHAIDEFLSLLGGASVELSSMCGAFPARAGIRSSPRRRSHPRWQTLTSATSTCPSSAAGARRRPTRQTTVGRWPRSGLRRLLRTPQFAAGERGSPRWRSCAERRSCAPRRCRGRCHRRLIADVFVLDGWQVLDLMPSGRLEQHRRRPLPVRPRTAFRLWDVPGVTPDCRRASCAAENVERWVDGRRRYPGAARRLRAAVQGPRKCRTPSRRRKRRRAPRRARLPRSDGRAGPDRRLRAVLAPRTSIAAICTSPRQSLPWPTGCDTSSCAPLTDPLMTSGRASVPADHDSSVRGPRGSA